MTTLLATLLSTTAGVLAQHPLESATAATLLIPVMYACAALHLARVILGGAK